jgi:galactokinase
MLASRLGAGPGSEVTVGFVPGRLEVLGRHTDYAGGRSLVCAINRGFLFAAAPSSGRTVRMYEDSPEFGEVSFDLSPAVKPPPGRWEGYPMTMARRLAANFGGPVGPRGSGGTRRAGVRPALRGASIAFSSTLPVGSGMSGSSALMMTAFTALAAAGRLWEHPAFRANIRCPVDLAGYLACAENGRDFRALAGDRGVGTSGGSEDHAAILCGRAGILSLFSFSPMTLVEELPWPRDWRLAVAFSGVRAEKTREAREKYNMASRRARVAVQKYNERFGTRYANLGDAIRAGARVDQWRSMESGNVPGIEERVRQFAAEETRIIPRALRALRDGDIAVLGNQLSSSHRASRTLLGNIVPEIDDLQRSAAALGARGASGFGAGFGGSILAVVPTREVRAMLSAWRAGYGEKHPDQAAEAAFFIAEPGPGIEVWSGEGPRRLVDHIFGAR